MTDMTADASHLAKPQI